VAFQINGNTIIDSSGSLIVNANTSIANNFSVQLTPFASRESTSPMQGTVAGFTAGGNDGSPPPAETNVIDKFPFANELTAVDHGDLTAARRLLSGQSSDTQGFVSGGYYAPASPTTVNIIEKFTFASASNATDHGDLTQNRMQSAGQSSTTDGYTSGGFSTTPTPANVNTIDKFPFASADGASDVGDLSQIRAGNAGQSSETNGYTSGGYQAPTFQNTIDKFPFASDTNASDVGDLTRARSDMSGQSSKTEGYTTAGNDPSPGTISSIIDKFPFASATNATVVGDLVNATRGSAGQNSREHGYSSGGGNGGSESQTMIERFPFAVDTDASDVGNLSQKRGVSAGSQD
jgi:hypothetical protein